MTLTPGTGEGGRKYPKQGKDKTRDVLPTHSSSSNMANASLKTFSLGSHIAAQPACLGEGQEREMWMAAFSQGKLFIPHVILLVGYFTTA